MIVYRLRVANAHYARVAHQMRASKSSQRGADSPYRRRAVWLGLRIDTERAAALSDNQVSKIPLPVLDTTPSPVAPKLYIRIPPFHTRPLSVPSIMINGNATTLGMSGQSRIENMYPFALVQNPVCIGNDWGVPGAPLMKNKELPALSPTHEDSPMSQDSGKSTPCLSGTGH